MSLGFWNFLQLLFSLSFVACAMSAYWNVLAARRVPDWDRRSALFAANHRATLRFGLTSVLLVGVAANLAALPAFALAAGSWVRCVNGLCIAALIVIALVDLPASRVMIVEARRAIHAGPTAAFDRALHRWRAGNAALLLLSVASIGLTVVRWRN
ncbi:MAG: hypothetical protein HYR73_04590 [Candidatus Eisenbacteria bacterium]|nr:hypothetical protein [Candidatus Eisenbacteria bacterium]